MPCWSGLWAGEADIIYLTEGTDGRHLTAVIMRNTPVVQLYIDAEKGRGLVDSCLPKRLTTHH